MSNPLFNKDVPVIGQTAVTVPAQLRLEAQEAIAKTLEQAKQLGIRHGRMQLPCAMESTTIDYIVHLDAIEAAGCRILSINEHQVRGPGGRPILMCHVVFRCPETLFAVIQ